MSIIPVAGPSITQKEIDYVSDAVQSAWYADANKYHDRFEKAFADYVGTSYAIALPSCTSAIHLALLACGVGPGDEVIVPDVTWIASVAPVLYVGAQPVFADIDEKSWCLSAESFRACITNRTKAVIPVNLYGGMAEYDTIVTIAQQHGIIVIEDAAEAIGSSYRGKMAGALGHVGVFSFHGSKTLTTGEGGMLVTNDQQLFERASFLRDHGRVPGDVSFRNREVAYKYKMSSMQAALGLAQLERIQELVDKKRTIFGWYQQLLGEHSGVRLNAEPDGIFNSVWMSTVVYDAPLDKFKLMALMQEQGTAVRPFFSPLSSLEAFATSADTARAQANNTISYRISSRGINLPSGYTLSEEDARRVCTALVGILERACR